MKLEIQHLRSRAVLHTFNDIPCDTSIEELKQLFAQALPQFPVSRQAFRIKAQNLKDDETLESLGLDDNAILYFKDLGPQIGWKTVFLAEYAGPLVLYALFYLRPAIVYGTEARTSTMHRYVHIACACYLGHYAKRLLETQFIHRFSNGTMPLGNLFKNCSYYWGFTCLVAYFVNHPLYTPASYGGVQFYTGLTGFILCELGNFSIHYLFRNLRPADSKTRMIPVATSDPFTFLFHRVSCPNYTYEAGAWLSFALLSQTLTALLFALAGLAQMSQWALKKHQNYRKEFKDYPIKRCAILPFLL